VILPFLLLGLFSTFHRLSWIVSILFFIVYLILFKKVKFTIASIIGLIIISGVISMMFFSNSKIFKNVGDSRFVKDRLFSDTISIRLKILDVTSNAIKSNPMGLGTDDNKKYYNLMKKHNLIKGDNVPYDSHNGFLSFGIKYGVLGLFSFSGLIISMIVYFYRIFSIKKPDTAYPFFIVLLWAMANLTNSISMFKIHFVLIIAMVCGTHIGLLRKTVIPIKE
jgi:O-antigen ligase